jgi:hypothetical protein
MSAKGIAENGDIELARPGRQAGNPTLLGRKSVLMGMLTSGFVIANEAQSSAAAAGTVKPIAATQAAYAPRWTPSTAYALGQQVITPNNDVVSAKVAHKSSAAYSADTVKWSLSSTYAPVPELTTETTNRQNANSGHVAATDPHGDRAHADASSPYVPWSVGCWYVNPIPNNATTADGQANLLLVNFPFYSGNTPITISRLDTYVSAAGDAAAVVRMGIYKVTNQASPLAWVAGAKWADLLLDAGTVSTAATGQRLITLGTPLVIPAATWFAVAGVEQAPATRATRYRGAGARQAGSPWGVPTDLHYSSNNPCVVALYQAGVSGVLPGGFTPGGGYGDYDNGVGILRSA